MQISFQDALSNIGKQVTKTAFNRAKGNLVLPKPFKSGRLFNTVKDVVMHPDLKIPAYTFEEDSTYVECRRCDVVDDKFMATDTYKLICEKLNAQLNGAS